MFRWCFPPKLCVFLSFFSLSISFSIPLSFSYSLSLYHSFTSLFCSLQTLIYILKGHMRPLLCGVIFNDFQIFWSTTLTYFNLTFFLTFFYKIVKNISSCTYIAQKTRHINVCPTKNLFHLVPAPFGTLFA